MKPLSYLSDFFTFLRYVSISDIDDFEYIRDFDGFLNILALD